MNFHFFKICLLYIDCLLTNSIFRFQTQSRNMFLFVCLIKTRRLLYILYFCLANNPNLQSRISESKCKYIFLFSDLSIRLYIQFKNTFCFPNQKQVTKPFIKIRRSESKFIVLILNLDIYYMTFPILHNPDKFPVAYRDQFNI